MKEWKETKWNKTSVTDYQLNVKNWAKREATNKIHRNIRK